MNFTKICLEIETGLKSEGKNISLPRADKLFTSMSRFYGYTCTLYANLVVLAAR